MLSGAFGRQPQLPSLAWPWPCPRTGAPCACWAGTVGVTLCLFLDALWWPSNNSCVPNCEPHTAPQGLIPASKHLLPPGGSRGMVSLPPPKCPRRPMDAFVPPFVHVGDSVRARSCPQLVAAALGMAPNAAGAKRGSAELGFICY